MNLLFRFILVVTFLTCAHINVAQKLLFAEINGLEESQYLSLGYEKNKGGYNYSFFVSVGNFGQQRFDENGKLSSVIPYYGVLPGSELPSGYANQKERCLGFAIGANGGFNWEIKSKQVIKFKFGCQLHQVKEWYSYAEPRPFGYIDSCNEVFWRNTLSFHFSMVHQFQLNKKTFIYYGLRLPYFFSI